MSKLQELKEQLKAQMATAAKDARETAEVNRITAQLEVMNSESFKRAEAISAARRLTSEALTDIDAKCEAVVASMPIHSTRTKENRKWNPSRMYGFGEQFAQLTGILSGMQYSASEHKALMMKQTGIDAVLIESILESLGSMAYYSTNYGVVVDEVPFNYDNLMMYLQLLEIRLGITLDRTTLTKDNFSDKFNTARLKAEKAKGEADLTEAMGQTIKINE